MEYIVLVQNNSMLFYYDELLDKWKLLSPQPTLPYYFHNEFTDQIYYVTTMGDKATKLFGIENDLFISQTNGNIYTFIDKKFTLCCSLIGFTGQTGQTGQTGSIGYGQTGHQGQTGQSGIIIGPSGSTGASGSLAITMKFDFKGITAPSLKKLQKQHCEKIGTYGLDLSTGKLYSYQKVHSECSSSSKLCNDSCTKKCHKKCNQNLSECNVNSDKWIRVKYYGMKHFHDKEQKKIWIMIKNNIPTEFKSSSTTILISTPNCNLYHYLNQKWIKYCSFNCAKLTKISNSNDNCSNRSIKLIRSSDLFNNNLQSVTIMDRLFQSKASAKHEF